MTATPYSASGAMPKAGRGAADTGPRIARLETFATPLVGFVRLTTEDGAQGWGQVSTYNADITAQVFHRQVAPWALGRGIDALEAVVAEIPEREHKYPGTYLMRALAGLDTAAWDWRGRRAGRPVAELLGGTAGDIRAYASSMRRDIAPEDEAARMLQLRDRHGFDAFKLRVGAQCGNDIDEWPGRTEAIVPALRRALGPDAALLADANSGFSPPRAIEVGRMLEAEGFEHFEEPCRYWRLEETAEVTRALGIDVAGGEQDWDLGTWERMVAMRAVDIVQPDILYLGGITRTLQVARMAAGAGLPCTPHAANLSMVTLFTMHLMRALPLAGRYLELSIEGPDYYPWQDDLFVESPYRITDGRVRVTDAPGWGVEIAPEWLSKSTYLKSEADA
ncbi:mandelate racemase/muconate lactonizing enzyme family protein [Roseivivax isoporae]|uniref:Mandelate racemase n=1 Tax=Roseivivax isoporae LMG 25204 TaxID=1449351 RepID=X7F5M1_9RHOB|nr:mandelate racemase/muconate lactonizing enzyme family protein [Roseivivax isoporae]ETX28070.1 mandelate racemase [Roseivivax isoporae LMG 25204]